MTIQFRQPAAYRGYRRCLLTLALLLLAGCGGPSAEPERIYGRRGVRGGEFAKPRAIAIDSQDRVYIVDYTARIQVFNRDGEYLNHNWTTPDYRNGRPSGLSIDRDGNLLVSDSHYHCLRVYSPEGDELRVIRFEPGSEPGQFGYISDAIQDREGFYYVAEFGAAYRITKLDADGRFVCSWGQPGTEPGELSRIRALTLGPDGNLYLADAINHRIQVFTRDGQFVRCWGTQGKEPGQLAYPYDLAFGPSGDLYVAEFGNHRVQKFTAEGVSLGCWGGPGQGEPGRLNGPWALAVDSKGRVHVLDSDNNRVQRIRF